MDGRENAPLDHDMLGTVARRGWRIGDHHRHDLAHEAHAVGRHGGVRRNEADVFLADDVFVWVSRHRTVRNRLYAIRRGIDPGEDCDHAGHGACDGSLDASDARVRVVRAHEARMDLTRQVDVVAVAATADDQTRVLLAEDVLAYALRRGSGSRLKKGHGVSPSRSRAVTPERRGHDRGEIPEDERRVVRIAWELWISLGVSVNGTRRRSARGRRERAAALQDDRLAAPARDMLASLRTHF